MTQNCRLVIAPSSVDDGIRTLVEEGLAAHTRSANAPIRVVTPVSVTVCDETSTVIGGLIGRTVWGWLHIEELWVAEPHRRSGLGTQLMNAAEGEALRLGCHGAYLDSFDFQAVPFYQLLGYEVFGLLQDFPVGHTRYFLRKALK